MEDMARRQEKGEEFPEEELRAMEQDLTGKVCFHLRLRCQRPTDGNWIRFSSHLGVERASKSARSCGRYAIECSRTQK